MHPPKEHIVKILEVVQETPKIRLLRLERPVGVEFFCGQFFMVSLVDDPLVKVSRAYSLASSPENKKHLEIGFEKVGVLTTKLFEMRRGENLKIKGPYGKFFFDEMFKGELILLGAGTGITPLMSVARQCFDKKLPNTVKLLYSVRVPEEIAYGKELSEMKKENPHFHYEATVTRMEESAQEWNGRRGRIDEGLLKNTIHHRHECLVFICGAKEFVFSMIDMLSQIGVSKEQIKTDVWG
jgi:ferredoxin-NADP reductase